MIRKRCRVKRKWIFLCLGFTAKRHAQEKMGEDVELRKEVTSRGSAAAVCL